MIFVQIAAYRDPELLPTVLDCIAKAKYPSDLRFGICWQRDASENDLDTFTVNRNFRIDCVPWEQSQGLCWARARIQRMYEHEEFTLQLDSHHRFAQDWDQKLMAFMELTDSPKPILTSYAGIYDPKTNQKMGEEPFKMVGERFTPSGTILFRPHVIPGWDKLEKPIRARFVSGHYFFTLGLHCQEYRYDPNLYFAGDEISLSIRSFCLGYDLFHPHRTLLWHEYTRIGRLKHWDDHAGHNRAIVQTLWHERDVISKRRLRKLLKEEENDELIDGYGLGSVRTHRDFELYAGIDFAKRRLHKDTLRGIDPPCLYENEQQWEDHFSSHYNMLLKWNVEDLDLSKDMQFIYFGVEDEHGNVLFRYDAPPDSEEVLCKIDRRKIEFAASSTPAKLIVWPVSMSRGWLKRTEYKL